MRATVHVVNPRDVEVAITLTLPLWRWKELLGQILERAYPSSLLHDHVQRAVALIEARIDVPKAEGQ